VKRGSRVDMAEVILAKLDNGEVLSSAEEETLYSTGTVEQVSKAFQNYPKDTEERNNHG
jgi:hypothetical protein